jgi:hypothetical protein
VGDTYLVGDAEIGVKKDEQKAFDHFRTASHASYGPAHTKTASCYMAGTGVQCNHHRAAEHYEMVLILFTSTILATKITISQAHNSLSSSRLRGQSWARLILWRAWGSCVTAALLQNGTLVTLMTI